MANNSNFKYDFKDLAKYMEDVSLLRQYGGNDVPEAIMKVEQAVPKWKSVLQFILYLFLWAFTVYALYLVYYILFKGYPKWIVNLFTGSMSKKADMDKLLKENNVLLGNFNYLLDKDTSYRSLWSVFNAVYGDNNGLSDKLVQLDQFIIENYDYPYDEKYMMAFREYFLFFFKIITDRVDNKCSNEEVKLKATIASTRDDKSRKKKKNDSNSDLVNTTNANFDLYKVVDVRDDKEQNVKMCIHHYQFYEALVPYLMSIGKLTAKHKTRNGDKNDTELIYQVFMEDLQNSTHQGDSLAKASNGKYYNIVASMKEKTIAVSKSAMDLNKRVNDVNNNILPFLVIPSSNDDVKMIAIDVRNYSSKIDQIYTPNVKFSEMNELSWYVFEALYHKQNNGSYGTFASYIAGVVSTPEIRAYLNLSSDKREFANQKLKMKIDNRLAEVFKKCPVFCHIYFNETPGMNKQALYGKVMSAYSQLMDMDSGFDPNDVKGSGGAFGVSTSSVAGKTDMAFEAKLNNLVINGTNLKKTVNGVNIMHLYLNQYALAINKNYEKQYLSDTQFFKELVTPVFHEFVVNRVFIAWYENIWRDSLFGPPFPTKNYKAFKPKYKWLENLMGEMVKATWKRLFTSSKVNEPKKPEQGL